MAEPGETWVEKGESTITPYGRGLATHNKIRAARKQPEQNHQQFLYGSLVSNNHTDEYQQCQPN